MHIELRSDNAAGVAPQVMAAVVEANTGSALAYGGDPWTEELHEVVAEAFGHPEVKVFPVASGTAANALALSAMAPPWGSVLCHETAHIIRNEGGATSMYGGGAVMRGLPGPDYKVTPESVRDEYGITNWGDPHHSQPTVLSLTCPTDFGTVYTVAEISALSAAAAERGLRMHLDGARLANAIASLHCSPADITHRAGVHVFSLGSIKNGGLGTDAIVSFDPEVSEQLLYRTKRSGHTASKMRFQSVQLLAHLRDGLWVKLARQSNAAMHELARGLRERGVELLADPQANMAFLRVGDAVADELESLGLLFYRMGHGVIRFVTSWQTTPDDVHEVLRRVDKALSAAGAAPATLG
jgi:threonine aldolase